jgi:hypothetical protein
LYEALEPACGEGRQQALYILEVVRWCGMTDAGSLGNTPQGKCLDAFFSQFILRCIQKGCGEITVVVLTSVFHCGHLDTVQIGLQNLDTVNIAMWIMTSEALFQVANLLALLGWLALFCSPLSPRIAMAFAGLVIPVVLSVGYTSLMLVHWASADGGFESLPAVAELMDNPWLLLAGWVHYLAFDLLAGTWEVRVARQDAIPHLLLLPCLALTFLLGPAGFLTFQALRVSRHWLSPSAAQLALQARPQLQDSAAGQRGLS